MSFQPLPAERNLSKFDVRRGAGFVRCTNVGLPSAYAAAGTEAIICDDREVALIDEIAINAITNDAATNKTVTLRINGVECPIHFPGVANLTRTERLVWRPRGNIVIHPGQTFAAKGVLGLGFEQMTVRFRKKPLLSAIADGDIKGGGRLPQVAVSGATVAATAKVVVAPVAGMCVEILSLLYTGHNFNAAADTSALGFWDGSTGTFAGNANVITRIARRGADPRFAQPVVIGNTDGCIQGGAGLGVYVSSTTNLAGTPPPADFIVVYRYIPDERLEVASTAGTAGAAPARRGKWWCHTDAAVTSDFTAVQLTPFFAATTGSDALVKVKGFVFSTTTATTAAIPTQIGFGVGAGPTIATPHSGLGEWACFNHDSGGPAVVSNTVSHDDTLLMANASERPGFGAYEFAANDVATRSMLAWGRFETTKVTQPGVATQSINKFII